MAKKKHRHWVLSQRQRRSRSKAGLTAYSRQTDWISTVKWTNFVHTVDEFHYAAIA